MAKECEFYSFDSWNCDYVCNVKKSKGEDYSISSDLVHEYCWSYNHTECPIYKTRNNSSSSGGCYLTTACVVAEGLPDDCEELRVMRDFRDNYVSAQPEGKKDIAHYYEVAPSIVRAIENSDGCACQIFNRIYHELILPCMNYIHEKKEADAYSLYRNYTVMLEKRFLEIEKEKETI